MAPYPSLHVSGRIILPVAKGLRDRFPSTNDTSISHYLGLYCCLVKTPSELWTHAVYPSNAPTARGLTGTNPFQVIEEIVGSLDVRRAASHSEKLLLSRLVDLWFRGLLLNHGSRRGPLSSLLPNTSSLIESGLVGITRSPKEQVAPAL